MREANLRFARTGFVSEHAEDRDVRDRITIDRDCGYRLCFVVDDQHHQEIRLAAVAERGFVLNIVRVLVGTHDKNRCDIALELILLAVEFDGRRGLKPARQIAARLRNAVLVVDHPTNHTRRGNADDQKYCKSCE